jgi:hypothetical protein
LRSCSPLPPTNTPSSRRNRKSDRSRRARKSARAWRANASDASTDCGPCAHGIQGRSSASDSWIAPLTAVPSPARGARMSRRSDSNASGKSRRMGEVTLAAHQVQASAGARRTLGSAPTRHRHPWRRTR